MDRQEALEIVKNLYNRSLFIKKDKEAVRTLIPEVAECDDKKAIRTIRELLETARDAQSNTSLADPFTEALNWLDKQDERKNNQEQKTSLFENVPGPKWTLNGEPIKAEPYQVDIPNPDKQTDSVETAFKSGVEAGVEWMKNKLKKNSTRCKVEIPVIGPPLITCMAKGFQDGDMVDVIILKANE